MKLLVLLFLFQVQMCFSQKDSTLIRDKFFLEVNAGIGFLRYSELYNSPSGSSYVGKMELSVDLFVGLFYRTYRLKLGVNSQPLLSKNYLSNSLSLNCGVNMLSRKMYPYSFFGPSIAYGFFVNPNNNLTLVPYRLQVGMDCCYKKIHIGLKYDFLYGKNPNQIRNARNLFLEIGYTFNLASFRKKK